MSIIKLKKKENLVILFGIKLPAVISRLIDEIKDKNIVYDIMCDSFNIDKERLINLVEAVNTKNEQVSILVVYKNIIPKKDRPKYDTSIDVFDFDIFEYEGIKDINVEKNIEKINNV